jgi:hypothetical protein
MKPAGLVRNLLITFSMVLLGIFLWWHWKLGMVRYFDVDEFAHLHWAAKMMQGKKPYIDFLTFFPPGFAWFLSPALSLGWGTAAPFQIARQMMFVVFAAMCALSGMIFWEMRRSVTGAIVAAMLLAFLPLPFDKYLEIRPDNVATVLILAAVYGQIRWMKNGAGLWPLLSGLSYSLSYIVLPKMVPNIAVGVLIAFLYGLPGIRKPLVYFFTGLAVPLVAFGLWAFSLGNPGLVWYSLFQLPVESNRISQYFIMMQDLFFNPNGIYYGVDGWTRPLYANHTLWVTGILFGVWRLITPVFAAASYGGVRRGMVLAELLIGLQLAAQLLFFVQFAPLKHAQYLIPIGVFVAWYGADFIHACTASVLRSRRGASLVVFVWLLGSMYLYRVFMESQSIKLQWTNSENIHRIAALYEKVPADEPVLDLTGEMLYNPDAYYACCIPFGQFAGFLTRPLPDLPEILNRQGTRYVNQGTLMRVNTLPWEWQQHIHREFAPNGKDESFLTRRGP